jgi:hypothetical protein
MIPLQSSCSDFDEETNDSDESGFMAGIDDIEYMVRHPFLIAGTLYSLAGPSC